MQNKCVYFHLIPNTGKVFYVGMGNRERPYRFNKRNRKWNKIVKEHGKPNVLIVADKLTVDKALETEKFWIKFYGLENLANISSGDDGTYNVIISNETRNKMRLSQLGKKRDFTKEHCEKIRQSKLGKPRNLETRLKLSKANKGKSLSEETKRKMSLVRGDKTIYEFYHPFHGIINCTRKELVKNFNLHDGCVSMVVHGKLTHHKEWRVAGNAS